MDEIYIKIVRPSPNAPAQRDHQPACWQPRFTGLLSALRYFHRNVLDEAHHPAGRILDDRNATYRRNIHQGAQKLAAVLSGCCGRGIGVINRDK